MLEHRGYKGRVGFDDEADVFHGEVVGFRTRAAAHLTDKSWITDVLGQHLTGTRPYATW